MMYICSVRQMDQLNENLPVVLVRLFIINSDDRQGKNMEKLRIKNIDQLYSYLNWIAGDVEKY